MVKQGKRKNKEWDALIRFTEARVERAEVKKGQLLAILANFRAKARAGEPCPTEIADLGTDLSKLLH